MAREVLPGFLDFIAGSYLIGHHVQFDLNFLRHESRMLNQDIRARPMSFCTAKMARLLLPELGRFNLGNVAYALGVDVKDRHRARADVQLTLEVFKNLLSLCL